MNKNSITGKTFDGKEFELIIDDWLNLKEISLQEHKLSEIDLSNLPFALNLKIINFSNNQISELDTISLQYCRNLVSLDLSNNCLRKIDLSPSANDQATLIFLEEINLSNNIISEINLNFLKNCINLKSFNLNNNNLEGLDISLLMHCKGLEEFQIDKKTKIEWRNTNLDITSLPKGLKKYTKDIEDAWQKFQKEVDTFRKTEPRIEDRLIRTNWLEQIAKENNFEMKELRYFYRVLYREVKNCYIYYCFRGVVSIVASLMEYFLTNEIPFEYIKEHNRFWRKKHFDSKLINLSGLMNIAVKKKLMSPQLREKIIEWSAIRHSVTHYPDATFSGMLGMKRKTIRGRGTKSRGASFESPGRKPMRSTNIQEGAERGIILFMNLVQEFKK